MSGLVLKDVQQHNLGYGYMAWYYNKVKETKGMGDGDQLIADAYQSLFLNYFSGSYIIETLERFQKNPRYNVFKGKVYMRDILKFCKEYDNRVLETMGEDYHEKYLNMSYNLMDAFKQSFDKLVECSIDAYRDKGLDEQSAIDHGRMQVCIMLNEFSFTNLERRIRLNLGVNPIMTRLQWVSHKPIHPWLIKLSDFMHCKDISKDLQTRAAYFKLQKTWNDEGFLGDHIGESVLEQTEYEAIELSDVLKKSKK